MDIANRKCNTYCITCANKISQVLDLNGGVWLIIWRSTNLVTEDLDLRVGSMNGSVTPVVVTVCVYLDHKWKTLTPFCEEKSVLRQFSVMKTWKKKHKTHSQISLTKHAFLSLEKVKYSQAIMSYYLMTKEPGGGFSTKLLSYKGNVLAEFKTRNVWY